MNTEQIKNIVLKAGKLMRVPDGVKHVTVKGASDYVTEIDKQVQDFISGELKGLYPDIQFLGEEKDNGNIDMSGSVWVLDPVDGTTNLIHDYRRSSISLALLENWETKLGIVYQPYTEELYCAELGKGAFLNGKQIHVSHAKSMEESMFSVGTSPYEKEKSGKSSFDLIYRVFMASQDVRRTGSAAIDMAEVAAGRVDGFFERNLKIWDYSAGKLLIEEAGGKVTDFGGNQICGVMRSSILCANPAIHKILLKEYI